jgi:ribulose-5-phosphate 4-epimerase/fuculose-1-phosphate aldolase
LAYRAHRLTETPGRRQREAPLVAYDISDKTEADHETNKAEFAVRCDLAAAYRLIALHGMDDSIYTHISARVPGAREQFLINPFGMLFRDVTAGSLVKIDLEGRLVEESPYEVNPAGFTIHSAIHSARHDAACVVHTHTVAGVSVSSLEEGLMSLNQWSVLFHNQVAYHDFEGFALDNEERGRLVSDLGPTATVMILRNHGLLTVGRTVSDAMLRMLALEKACQAQIAILSTGRPVRTIPETVLRKTLRQLESGGGNRVKAQQDPNERAWRAMLQRLEPQSRGSYSDP